MNYDTQIHSRNFSITQWNGAAYPTNIFVDLSKPEEFFLDINATGIILNYEMELSKLNVPNLFPSYFKRYAYYDLSAWKCESKIPYLDL